MASEADFKSQNTLAKVLHSMDSTNGMWTAIIMLISTFLTLLIFGVGLAGVTVNKPLGVAVMCIAVILVMVAIKKAWRLNRGIAVIVLLFALFIIGSLYHELTGPTSRLKIEINSLGWWQRQTLTRAMELAAVWWWRQCAESATSPRLFG